MKTIIILYTTITLAACNSSEEIKIADAGDTEVDLCSCTNEPVSTSAKAQACGVLIESMTPREIAEKKVACRQDLPVPEGGPDLCFCLKTFTTDPVVAKACEAIIPKNITPEELVAKQVACSS